MSSTLAWGALSVLVTEFIHKPIENLVVNVLPKLPVIAAVCAVSAIFIADMIVSFRAAWRLRGILEKMTAIKEEIEELQQRLTELSREKKEQLEEIKEESLEWLMEIRDENKQKMELRRKTVEEAIDNMSDDIRRQMEQKLLHLRDSYSSLKWHPDKLRHSILKRNPSARSRKFEAALEEYRGRVANRINEHRANHKKGQ